MERKTRLELTWIGKDERPRLEPRILIEDPEKSYRAPSSSDSTKPIFDNQLIFGDNLLALKALEQDFAGKVKCVFIDPPYNTGSAFEHYDDGLEHSVWLSMMRDRLEIIRRLMSEDGSLWITIDDNEAHYLKVLCDEIFGRKNFISNVVWQKKYAPANDSIWLSDSHDHILVFSKDKTLWRPNLLERTESADAAYKNPDNDARGLWKSGDYTCAKTRLERPNLYYPIYQPTLGREIWPSEKRVWAFEPETHKKNVEENLVWWGKNGRNSVPSFKRFRDKIRRDGIIPQTVWLWEEVGHTQDGRKEQIGLHPASPFSTPKPEGLLNRILHIATNPGDLVLDSFAGSGTTGAVAHKMGRRWIMVELGEHCHTHIIPRLKKVIDGQDAGGITEAVGWQGGGGFRYFRLAPSLLERDRWGNWVIAKDYNAVMLAEALCKHMGFTYAPSQEPADYWRHGHSSERDFIYVTTANLTHDQLKALSLDVGPERTLLVCCKAFNARTDEFENLTVKKIPHTILSRCEWGRDDYSLSIPATAAAPSDDEADDEPVEPGDGVAEEEAPKPTKRRGRPKKTAVAADQPLLALDDPEA